MCGIAGIHHADGRPIDRRALQRMGDSIAHRGPDGEGTFVGEDRPSIGLMSRRLAVIDVAHGDQPMTHEGATIVYNGEIFNTAELRAELEAAGHRFRTTCDTEVVLHGYVAWGADVLQRLNGMWALAIWDEPRRRLFLARDRLGVKPLVYAETKDGLVFGSEIKALMASGLVERELDTAALPHYLSSFTVPEPQTFVRGVRRLPAGHTLTVDPGGVSERMYWDCALEEEDDRGADAYRGEVEALLADAVKRRLVSDVPLGVLLSSGVDSRLVAAYAAQAPGPRLQTFTLGFDDQGADERAGARAVAQALGSEHHEQVLTGDEALHALPDLLAAYDEPGQSLVQNHVISRFARTGVTVALSGTGADELFAAYPSHVASTLMSRFDGLPGPLRGVVAQAARLAPVPRLRRAAALAQMRADDRVSQVLLHQTPATLREQLLAPDVRALADLDAPVRALEELLQRTPARDPLNRLLYVYIKTYLTNELLRATDAMSMLHSLEVRTPFLDYRLVELAMRMPAQHKMRLRTGKLVLRELAECALSPPPERTKRGFAPPVGPWLRSEAGELVREALSEPTVRARGIFDPQAVREVCEACLAGDDRMLPPAMMLYSFETWAQQWLDAAPAVAAPRPVEFRGARPALSVIVVNWNTREILRDCLTSLATHLIDVDHEVIVVDNASSDGSADMVAKDFPAIRLMRNVKNSGFAAANNQAMRVARGEWLLLLNSDTLLTDDSVARLIEKVRRMGDIAVAQCRLRFPDGRLQYSAHRFPTLRLALLEDLGLHKLLGRRRAASALLGGYWDHDVERDVDWVIGAFMLLPREVFEQTGGFDESIFMYGEDMEWCQRVRDAGLRIRFFPEAEIVHRDHSSAAMRYGDERAALCLRRQYDQFLDRNGPARARIFMALRVTGAGVRAAWYSGRARAGGRGSADYRVMQPFVMANFRTLRAMAARRR
ncbi:MAG: asparagine synthase (glutamine-hydrolyzing) [Solirubrobacteraceae bacterium]